jgi:NitT/TauT family transport system substrate-binding protein
LEDLAGKKIAYNAGTTSETELNSALSVTGLTFDDIEPYEMEPSNIVAAMTSGSVDACTTWNPYSSQILESVEDAQEIEFTTNSVNMSSWICLPDYAKENRDILVRFNKAIFKAMQYSSNEDNWDYAIGLYATQCAKDKEACQVETSDATWFSADDVKNYIADGTMQDYYTKQQQTFIDNGDVESEVPLDDYILFDVMEDALQ